MSRSPAHVHQEMLSLLPPGWIWPRAEEKSLLAAVLQPAAVMISEIEATAAAMMEEIDPRTAVHCLPDFERVLGPDPCGRDLSTLSVAERQQLAHQRWTARGGQSVAYFTAFAARRGVDIRIREARPSQVGVMLAGDELINSPEQFIWRIELLLGIWDYFRAGEHTAGDLLFSFELSDIECDLRRLQPAQSRLIFTYVPEFTELAGIWDEGEPLYCDGEQLAVFVPESN